MNNLNLDELVPEVKSITLAGKDYDCYPPTIEQMLRIADLENKLNFVKTENEAVDLINDTLNPVVPGIDCSKITKDQLIALTSFILSGTIPERLKDKLGKKKQESLKQ